MMYRLHYSVNHPMKSVVHFLASRRAFLGSRADSCCEVICDGCTLVVALAGHCVVLNSTSTPSMVA